METYYSYGSVLSGQWAYSGYSKDFNEAKAKALSLRKSRGGVWNVKESFDDNGTHIHGLTLFTTMYMDN